MTADAGKLPLLGEPLEPSLTTVAGYAEQRGVSESYIQSYWMPRPRFPRPVGRLAGRGRNGGGRGRKVYRVQDLDAFRAGEPRLHPRQVARIVYTGPDQRVTLGFFADHSAWESGGQPDRKTISQYKDHPGFPRGRRGRYQAGDLVTFFNTRPGRKARSTAA
ncbi:MAG: hypothetical protein ACRDRJ_47510 [Streptosporangiaceae bacterium]